MDIDITGARILISRPEWGGFMLTETVVVTWVVMLILVLACRFMTAHLEVHPTKKRQVIAEWIVTSIRDMVQTNMGEKYAHTWYVPFIGAMFALSAGCSLSSVVGAYAPTSDLAGLGAVCFCADYHHEDQDERLRRLSARLHHADPCDDAV